MVRARGLAAKDHTVLEKCSGLAGNSVTTNDGGSDDAYVMLSCGTEWFKTAVVKHNLNPTWNERFVFGASVGKRAQVITTAQTLKVAVYDQDTLADDVIGEVHLNLAHLACGEQWHRLRPAHTIVKGISSSLLHSSKKKKSSSAGAMVAQSREEELGEVCVGLRPGDVGIDPEQKINIVKAIQKQLHLQKWIFCRVQ